jgi:hypothetical protein
VAEDVRQVKTKKGGGRRVEEDSEVPAQKPRPYNRSEAVGESRRYTKPCRDGPAPKWVHTTIAGVDESAMNRAAKIRLAPTKEGRGPYDCRTPARPTRVLSTALPCQTLHFRTVHPEEPLKLFFSSPACVRQQRSYEIEVLSRTAVGA